MELNWGLQLNLDGVASSSMAGQVGNKVGLPWPVSTCVADDANRHTAAQYTLLSGPPRGDSLRFKPVTQSWRGCDAET